jgi:hypothetical protein
LKKLITKRDGGVAQDVGPELKKKQRKSLMLTLFKNFLKTSDTGENKIIEYLMRNPSLIFHLSDDM